MEKKFPQGGNLVKEVKPSWGIGESWPRGGDLGRKVAPRVGNSTLKNWRFNFLKIRRRTRFKKKFLVLIKK